jgi:hypothetical protein
MNLYSSVVMQVIGLTDEAICDVMKGRSGIALMKGRTGGLELYRKVGAMSIP